MDVNNTELHEKAKRGGFLWGLVTGTLFSALLRQLFV